MADLAGIVAAALVEMAVEEQSGAEAGAKEQIDEAVEVARHAVEALADRRRGGVVLDRHGNAGQPLQLFGDRKVLPAGQRGRADRGHPLDAERTRHRHADAEQAAAVEAKLAHQIVGDRCKQRHRLAGVGRSTRRSMRARTVPDRSVITPTSNWWSSCRPIE